MLKFYVMTNDMHDVRRGDPRPRRVVAAIFEAGYGSFIRVADGRDAWRLAWSTLRSLISQGETGVKIVCFAGDQILGKVDASGAIEHWVCEP